MQRAESGKSPMFLGLLPVAAYIALIATLHIAMPRHVAASLVFDPPVLMLVLNTVFLFGISFAVSTIASRAYMASGFTNILLLGCGVLALGTAALAGGWVRPLGGAANTSVTIHNLGVLMGAVLHGMSAILTMLKLEPEQPLERRRRKLLLSFGITLLLMASMITAALLGIVPSFWVQGVGSTPLKQGVLGTAITLLALTSLYMMSLYVGIRTRFLYWYSLALALTSIGLIGISVMKVVGGPIGWAGRTAQYLGGIYFLVAALSALREAQAQGLTMETAINLFYRRSELHYRDLVETVSDAIISVDDMGRVLLWNQGAERMMGYTPDEAAGCTLGDLIMPGDQKKRLDDELKSLQKQLTHTFATKDFEIQMHRKGGALFPSETSLTMRRIGSGVTSTLVVRDITERKKLEENLRKSRDELEMRVKERTFELERRNKELQDFAFIASHDLQEPLRKVQTFGDLLAGESTGTLSDTAHDYIGRMQKAAARMQALLGSLLSYSRVTTKEEPVQVCDLNRSLETALSNLEVMIKDRQAHLEVGRLPIVEADRVQMVQLLQNLLANALKFQALDRKPQVKIFARPTAKDQRPVYEIVVEDNGVGFDEKYLDKIFMPFQRLHGRGEYEGVGMGLSICKKIVERHGGHITGASTLGLGSTFVVTLPARQNEL